MCETSILMTTTATIHSFVVKGVLMVDFASEFVGLAWRETLIGKWLFYLCECNSLAEVVLWGKYRSFVRSLSLFVVQPT